MHVHVKAKLGLPGQICERFIPAVCILIQRLRTNTVQRTPAELVAARIGDTIRGPGEALAPQRVGGKWCKAAFLVYARAAAVRRRISAVLRLFEGAVSICKLL